MADENKALSPKELIAAEYIKCKNDVVYFLKKYCYIQHPIKGKQKFNLYPFQEKLARIAVLKDHDNVIINKSRQMGISTLMSGICVWEILFHSDVNILVIATKQSVAVNLITKVKYMYDNLPHWMTNDPERAAGKKGSNVKDYNKQSIKLRNNSQIKAVAASPDAGRSEAVTLLVIDEAAHIEGINEIYTSIKPTLALGGRCIALSSPLGMSNWFYRTFQGAVNGTNNFIPIELPWHHHPDRDEAWFMRESADMSPQEIAQEYNCDFLASGNTVIDPTYIKRAQENTVQPPMEKRGYGREMWIWKYPEPGHKYIIACLPPDEKVLTDSGLKRIEDVNLIDKLVNRNGNYVEIFNKQIHEVISEDMYEFKVDNTFRTTKFTKEHPILVSKPILKRNYLKNNTEHRFNERYWDFDFKYTKSENVRVGDWIKVPNVYKKQSALDINTMWNNQSNVRVDFAIDSPLKNNDFWWFIGMWLGDGWLLNNDDSNICNIEICFNKNEMYFLDKCSEIIKTLFNRTPILIESETTYKLKFSSKELYNFLNENFGQLSSGKKISEWVKYIIPEYKKQLLKGYFDSDGCWVKSFKKDKSFSKISYVSINLELLESIQDILFSLGIVSALFKLRNSKKLTIEGRIVNCKECYNLCLAHFDSISLIKLFDINDSDIKINKFSISDFPIKNKRIISGCHLSKDTEFIYFKIKNINKSIYTGKVYNFECDTHSYMCHHITTHNCDVSRGDSLDYSTMQIIDTTTVEQVAEYQAKVSPTDFAREIVIHGYMYNEALLVIENNGLSLAVVEPVVNSNYPNLYYTTKGGIELFYNEFTKRYMNSDTVPGFTMSARIRPMVINKLQEYFRQNSVIIRSSRTITELNTFIWTNNKAQADNGCHDDLVIPLATALFVRDTHAEFMQTYDESTRLILGNMQKKEYPQLYVNNYNNRSFHNPYLMHVGNNEVEDISWVIGRKLRS